MHHCGSSRLGFLGLLRRPRETGAIESCPECAQWSREVESTLAAVRDGMRQLDPPEEYWSAYTTRLRARLDAPKRPRFVLYAGGAGVLATAAALLLFVLPRAIPRRAQITPAQSPAAASQLTPPTLGPEPQTQPVLSNIHEFDYGQHLASVRLLLTSLKNDAATADMPRERALAQRLLVCNRILRRSAESTGDAASQSVLDRVEPFLLDLTHGSSPADLRDQLRQSSIFGFLVIPYANPETASDTALLPGGIE
jgi:hypothetical protein